MPAADVLTKLMTAIDERRWGDLEQYLHPGFSCRYVHTGEQFDRTAWIRLNAEYPGFDRLRVEEILGADDRAACRSHVTGRGGNGLEHYACATFVLLDGNRIIEMTEVWTDMSQTVPVDARPSG
ncbi:hypothetical protein [Microbacterium sp. NIBRBAC000506063]|uniref:hypothetical protein n=1 Tax=Microbacterium sp. NIBRBAC000506063 TaxID=2734618 RepID=UPI001BB55393|nr:hypothetical protein [Microbacterium sp. NIBRBAC000506063]QTV79720.1 hypothetical protein KAE78_13325 [Microbacterium sp. NIBRBAC000506063]